MSTGVEVAAALKCQADIGAMMSDPDLTGDVLLLALGLLHATASKDKSNRWSGVMKALGWRDHDLRSAIRDDFPRYEPDRSQPVTCGAMMIRRDGICGKQASPSLTFTDRDPETGVGKRVGFCSRHGEMQFDVRARMKAWYANGEPHPGNNLGGVLPRYFESDWDQMYAWSSYGRKPEHSEGKPATPPKPVFRLIKGGAS